MGLGEGHSALVTPVKAVKKGVGCKENVLLGLGSVIIGDPRFGDLEWGEKGNVLLGFMSFGLSRSSHKGDSDIAIEQNLKNQYLDREKCSPSFTSLKVTKRYQQKRLF